ncbi:MAG: hypothetical protein IBJ18_10375 [Phycisphaerales bacterium]|nr:hypothetical protein [Phycisphaerales bacterium]
MPTARTLLLCLLFLLTTFILPACAPTPHPHISVITIDEGPIGDSDIYSPGLGLTPQALSETFDLALQDNPNAIVLDVSKWGVSPFSEGTLDLAIVLAEFRPRTRLVVWFKAGTIGAVRVLYPIPEWYVHPQGGILAMLVWPAHAPDSKRLNAINDQIINLSPDKPACLITCRCVNALDTCEISRKLSADDFKAKDLIQHAIARGAIDSERALIAKLNLPPTTRIDRRASAFLAQRSRDDYRRFSQSLEISHTLIANLSVAQSLKSDPTAVANRFQSALAALNDLRALNRPDLIPFVFQYWKAETALGIDLREPNALDKLEKLIEVRLQNLPPSRDKSPTHQR